MIRSMVAGAVFAGFAAGLVSAALQFAFVSPVLLEAELYEAGIKVHVAANGVPGHHDAAPAQNPAVSDGVSGSDHVTELPAQPLNWTRAGWTVVFISLVYVGYALLMVAGFAFARTRGISVTARAGMLWGVCGFIALHLAPAAGLPPHLPGMSAADVVPGQIWWVATAVLTAAGLALLGYGRGWPLWGMAAVLILLPHVIGAPHPHDLAGPTPPELAAQFAGRALATGMAGWVVLGLALGWFWQREDTAA